MSTPDVRCGDDCNGLIDSVRGEGSFALSNRRHWPLFFLSKLRIFRIHCSFPFESSSLFCVVARVCVGICSPFRSAHMSAANAKTARQIKPITIKLTSRNPSIPLPPAAWMHLVTKVIPAAPTKRTKSVMPCNLHKCPEKHWIFGDRTNLQVRRQSKITAHWEAMPPPQEWKRRFVMRRGWIFALESL